MPFTLVKHDVAIASAAVRELRLRIGDLLTIMIGLPLLTIVARAWLSGLPGDIRDLVTYGISVIVAMVLAKALLERVWFHRTEGVLARFAQGMRAQLSYVLVLMFAGILAGFAVMEALGILDLEIAAIGTCGGIASGLAIPFIREVARRWWRNIAPKRGINLLQHQHALVMAASLSVVIGAICATLPQAGYLGAIVASGYGLVVIVLTGQVDAKAVRFMTLVGHTTTSLLRHWLPVQLALLWPIAAVLLITQSWAAAGGMVILASALPVMTMLRILAYRQFSRVIADWIVAGLIAGAAYASLSIPPLGPAVLVAATVWLMRRGSDMRWLLA